MRYKIQTTLFFILVSMLISCAANERIYYKDNVTCTASNRNSKEWVYYKIELGNPTDKFTAQPIRMIRLKNGLELKTDKITVESIENLANCKDRDFVINSTSPYLSWPEGAKSIGCDDFISFIIRDNTIYQLMLVHQGEFRSIENEKWYNLPCKESEIIEVFGEADQFYEWFRE